MVSSCIFESACVHMPWRLCMHAYLSLGCFFNVTFFLKTHLVAVPGESLRDSSKVCEQPVVHLSSIRLSV